MAELKRALRAPEVTTQTATPGAGKRLLYPKSDGWYEKNSAGVETKVGPSAGGGGPVTEQTVSTDYINTQPASPTSGLTLFSRFRARRLPAFVGPTGQDSRLQPFLASNRVCMMNSVNASPTPTLDGMGVTWLSAGAATPTAVTTATTSFYTAMVRTRAATTAAVNIGAGVRASAANWFLSSTANLGGFHFVARFGLNVASTGSRGFVGMTSQTGAYAPATDPGTQLNQIGVFWNAASTTMSFGSSGTAVGTPVALGTNFPVAAGVGVYFYELSIYAPSGSGQTVYWSITRVNDGIVSNGGPLATGATTMPALNLLLTPQVYIGTGTLAVAQSIDVQSLYIESDN